MLQTVVMRSLRGFAFVVVVALLHARADAAATIEYEVITVADGVYAFVPSDIGIGNTVAVVTDADVIIVDASATPSGARQIIDLLGRLTAKPVRYLITTHWHDDHLWGNQAFREAYPGVVFVAHRRTRAGIVELAVPALAGNIARMKQKIAEREEILRDGVNSDGDPIGDDRRAQLQERVDLFREIVADLEVVTPILPTVIVGDGLTLERSDGPVHIRHLGAGHTDGDLVVHLPTKGVLIAGDLLTYPVPTGSYPVEWIRTLWVLSRLNADVVIPGHGPPLRDRAHLRNSIEVLESVVSQVRKAVSRGLSIEQTHESVDVGDYRSRFVGDDPRLGRMFDTFFLQLAIDRTFASLVEQQ